MESEISRMEWDEFEQSLSAPARGARRGAASEKELREYFGDKEFETLRRLAGHSRHVRSRAAPAGNVVFLHGIMGSNLASVDKGGGEDSIWVHFLRLAQGKIARLKLSEDGSKEADSAFHVRPVDVDKRTYARAILFLQARWRVEPFAYDWRKDIDLAADELARFIKQKFKGEPAHLLAHSMGGLVSRNFIRLHREMWEGLHDPEGVRGGRLIMLGTPNYGSFAIPQTMTGAEKMVRLLAAADLKHSLPELLEIINTFVGSYQLLPAPGKIPVPAQSLYRCESWGNFKVSEAHLQRAFDFHLNLENDGTIDRERMIYVAGCAQETLAGLTLVAPGEFDYSITFDGDGRVPHTLGLLKDVPTYYVEESHGDLARNETVLSAVDELLERGKTSLLSERPIASRALPRATMRWHRSPVDAQEAKRLQEIAQQADNEGGVPPDIERAAEQAIMRAAFGEELLAQEPAGIEAVPVEKQESATLRVEVVLGDITRITASVVAVGHYKGVPPTHAVGAINEALDGWIAKATSRGMVGCELGELFFIPITHRQVGAESVVLAGMGEFGKFTRDDQMYLLANITHAAGALKLPGFATVLIGAGEGNLSVERALRGMMTGVCEALHRMKPDERITQLTLVEINEKRFNEILDLLKRFRDEKSIAGLKLEIASRKTAIKRTRAGAKRAIAASGHKLAGTRITIERDGDVYRYSALSNSAVISVRQVEVQSYFAQGAAERLMTSRTREEQEQYGRLLNTYLVPEDFQRIIDNPPLTLILDRSTAAVPWEMASYRSAKGAVFFGPHLHLARQFRTLLSPAPGLAPALNRQLKVLVIADPAPEPELQLPGARLEGRKVVEVLRQFKGDKKPKDGKPQKDQLDIEVVDRIGATECDPIEILALILNQEFDVVHFAGHGIFDEKAPDKSGWVFGEDRVLSAREIFRARRVPRLVFANACFSAVVRPGEAFACDDTNRQLAGLAEAFFERGIHNYIGAGWPVDDEPAVRFAEIFYKRALDGETLGEALAAARRAILHQGSTWGAYHHYGQAETPLVDVDG